MKYYIDGILVVEGKEDSSYLNSFIDAMFVTTNGYDIPDEEIDFLNHASNKKKIIILTDPDDAGKRIREKLNHLIPSAINVEVSYDSCHKNNKHGIAECDKETLIYALKEHFTERRECINNKYTYLVNENDSSLRDVICKKFHLGKCNVKTMIKRLNYLKISEDEVKQVVENYHGNK